MTDLTYSPYWTSWIEKRVDGEKQIALDDEVKFKRAFDAIWEKKQEKARKNYDDTWKVKARKHEHWE